MLNNITTDRKLNMGLHMHCHHLQHEVEILVLALFCSTVFVLSPYFYVTTFSAGSPHSHQRLELQASSQTSQSVLPSKSVAAHTLVITVIISANSASSSPLFPTHLHNKLAQHHRFPSSHHHVWRQCHPHEQSGCHLSSAVDGLIIVIIIIAITFTVIKVG